jgi:protein-S-isoprenylcysteine O-methyltransferase Ste14
MAAAIGALFWAIWVSWCLYWFISALGVKPVRRHESLASRAGHIVPLTIAVALMTIRSPPLAWLTTQILPQSIDLALVGAAITAAGLAFTVWARRVLGTNWSGTVTVKHEHELITAGPYRYVRHPIYSGLLLAFAGSALAWGQTRSLLAFAIAAFALRRKWRLEERFMRDTFGAAYSEYARRTPAVIPRVF